MLYRREKAVETLRSVAQALAAAWAGLSGATRDEVEALFRRHGPEIAGADALNFVSRVIELLEALWELRDVLPDAANAALLAGREAEPEAGRLPRAALSVDAAARQALLDELVRVVDFRVFQDPEILAQDVSALITAHQDRLTPDERTAWSALDAAYQRDADAGVYLHAVEALLAPKIATVRAVLARGKTWRAETYRRMMMPRWAPRGAPSGEAAMAPSIGDQTADVTRYANVYFPATVLRSQEMVPLIVHIAQQFQAKGVVISEEQARLTLRVGDLTLIVHAEGFEVVSASGGTALAGVPAARVVSVAPERDCEPVVFFLDPQSPGRKKISIDVYQFDRRLVTLAFETDVVDQVAITELANVRIEPVPIVSPGEDAQPPDLELRVVLSADQRTLSYTLHSPGTADYHFKPVGKTELMTDPRAFLQPTLDRLSTLARISAGSRSEQETRRAAQELTNIGANLYADLFPEEFRREYRKFREAYRGKSLLITSDDPWIPWEMVKPVESDENGIVLYDDPPLCEMFQLSRWLAGRGAPDQLNVARGAWVAPADNLVAAQEETDYFTELQRQQWAVSLVGPLSTVPDVEAQFQAGNVELFHFACHGNFNTEDPNESKLKLAGDYLRPSQIVGLQQAGLRRAKPVVFLNACHGGEMEFALTGLGGWTQQFLDSGASAFIGSLWEINDALATRFAREFYNRLWGLAGHDPTPLGRAFYEARMIIKEADPANPTWLAYALYGDPYGRVRLGRDTGTRGHGDTVTR
ncbi:MAG: hypothetical protein CVU38_10920 [Chloroflexi bacterium HGW-Chloroflexi-1]|nr:MAG: hypothetical protein CVU38_10920 [Chloroflexi bacterium HGW-Chloroflexi-1]